MAYRASTFTSNTANATSMTCSVSANAVVDDIAILMWTGGHSAGATHTPPTGWTLITVTGGASNPIINPGVTYWSAFYWKRIVSGDIGASQSFATSAIFKQEAAIQCFSGRDTGASPIDIAVLFNDSAATNQHAVPNGSTGTAGCDIVEFVGDKGAGPSTGYTLVGGSANSPTIIGYVGTTASGASAIQSAWFNQAGSGSIGVDTWQGTISAVANAANTGMIAIKPAAVAAATPTPVVVNTAALYRAATR